MGDAAQDLRQETREVANLIGRLRDLCGDDEQAFLDTLEGETEVMEAASRVVRWMQEQNANRSVCESLAGSYKERAGMFGERGERARVALFHFLEEVGMKSMALPEATISLVNRQQVVTGDADPKTMPDKFVRTRRELDRAAIKAAIQAGEVVEGFSLSNGPPTIMVRVRR